MIEDNTAWMGSEFTTLLLYFLRNLLLRKESHNKVSGDTLRSCRDCQKDTDEDLLHIMFLDVSHALVQTILPYDGTKTLKRLLILEYYVSTDDLEFLITWVRAEVCSRSGAAV